MTDAHDAKAMELAGLASDLIDENGNVLETIREIAKAMSAALRDCEREALERAAKVVEWEFMASGGVLSPGVRVAARIRALKGET